MKLDGYEIEDPSNYECASCGEYSITVVGCWIYRYTLNATLCDACCNRIYKILGCEPPETWVQGPEELI